MLDLESMSLVDLKTLAKEHNIKNISKLKPYLLSEKTLTPTKPPCLRLSTANF